MTTYRVRAVRSGRWWAIDVPELPGVHSQARRLDQVEDLAREAIALMLDTPQDAFELVIEPDLNSLGTLESPIKEALQARQTAQYAQQQASATMRHAVREIREAGYTSRDAGILLGVSNQRISQLEHEAAEGPPKADAPGRERP